MIYFILYMYTLVSFHLHICVCPCLFTHLADLRSAAGQRQPRLVRELVWEKIRGGRKENKDGVAGKERGGETEGQGKGKGVWAGRFHFSLFEISKEVSIRCLLRFSLLCF